jgi:hypothetical protein
MLGRKGLLLPTKEEERERYKNYIMRSFRTSISYVCDGVIKSRNMSWADRVVRMDEEKNLCKISDSNSES